MFEYRGSVVTYYKLNQDESVYDKELLYGGSYERVGDLSGLRFDKIVNFYVAGSEQIVPTINANEQGVLIDYRTTIMFPAVNFKPTMYDFVRFTINNNPVGPLFQIINFQLAYMRETVDIYKCDIKGVGIPIEKIEEQVVAKYGYIDIDHRIHDFDEYLMILQALKNITDLEATIETDQITSSILLEWYYASN